MSSTTVKLTLTIPEETLKSAKAFSKKYGKSISKLVTQYLSQLTQNKKSKTPGNVHPLVSKMTGIVNIPSSYQKLSDKDLVRALRDEKLLKS